MRIGENEIIEIPVFASNGTTPIDLATLTLINVKISQGNKIISDVTYPATGITIVSNIIKIQITSAVSAQLLQGIFSVNLTLKNTDANFTVDGGQVDRFEIVKVIYP